ncbi:hypothetical protein [Pararhodobacter sp.]|uniref:hypothetical protein n=1 Tax=Pararhodobacter sp. TaxID=2127056 RepID=UPI002FDDEA8B
MTDLSPMTLTELDRRARLTGSVSDRLALSDALIEAWRGGTLLSVHAAPADAAFSMQIAEYVRSINAGTAA